LSCVGIEICGARYNYAGICFRRIEGCKNEEKWEKK
jgi:hypothetical protein